MEGEIMFIKLKIFRIKDFFKIVNNCIGDIEIVFPKGEKANIKNQAIQDELQSKYTKSNQPLALSLNITNPKDYFQIVMFSISDC